VLPAGAHTVVVYGFSGPYKVNCISVAHGMTSKERPTFALNERDTNYTYSIVISFYND
jgi:hypothetical protein